MLTAYSLVLPCFMHQHIHALGGHVFVLSIISIILVRTNFVGAVLGSVAGLMALA